MYSPCSKTPAAESRNIFRDPVLEQGERIRAMWDWCARTYTVDDPEAVAVLARKSGGVWDRQEFFRLAEILDHVQAGQTYIPAVFDEALTDCYASLSLYYKEWRCASTVRWIPACFLDLDCYKQGYRAENVPAHLVEVCRIEGIPEPTEITYTGRGLLVRWALDEPLRAWPEKVALWDQVQAALCRVFAPLGADDGARDSARISRPDGTRHSGSGRTVFSQEVGKEPVTLDELAQALGVLVPARKYTGKRKRRKVGTSRKVLALVPKDHRAWTLAIEANRRMVDLSNLVAERGSIAEGHRKDFLLFYAAACLMAGWSTAAIREQAHLFGVGFSPAFTRAEVDAAVDDALKPRANGKPYRWRSHTIAVRLEITPDEQQHMATLVTQDERERRRGIRWQESDTGRLILSAFERHPGARQVDLAEVTAKNQSTVSRYLGLFGLRTQPKNDGRGRPRKTGRKPASL